MADPSFPIPAADAHSTPDWSVRSEDIACPMCEYNLRGLTDPRCPECGYQFQWADLLDPSRREHPYLFELKRKSNFTSLWKTAFHGLRPMKFWSALRADHRCIPRRLIAYWFVVNTTVLLAFASDYFVEVLRDYLDYRSVVSALFVSTVADSSLIAPPRPVPTFSWPIAPLQDALMGPSLVLAWPCLTFLALSIFQISMRRAKVKQVHVLRCVVYCGDILLCIASAALMYNAGRAVMLLLSNNSIAPGRSPGLHLLVQRHISYDYSPAGQAAVFWIVWIIFVYRLTIAYWRYLKFEHVLLTLLTSQIIAGLTVLAVLSLLHDAGILR